MSETIVRSGPLSSCWQCFKLTGQVARALVVHYVGWVEQGTTAETGQGLDFHPT
jgi:hypothetical protein